MKFRYKKYGDILRPVIPVGISFKGKSFQYEVLLDSGADSNIFHAGLTQILGIDLVAGVPKKVFGINLGEPEPYWVHEVDLIVGGHLHKLVKVGFKQLGTTNYGVVGQQGFFDLYIVKFDLLKEEIELKPRN